jgi:hypothetical protein
VRAARVGAGVRGAGAADGAGGLPPLQRRARVPLPVAPLLPVKMVGGLQTGASRNDPIILITKGSIGSLQLLRRCTDFWCIVWHVLAQPGWRNRLDRHVILQELVILAHHDYSLANLS